jgi:glycosyltransferase involved in cell wall biosynthesis
VTLVSFVIPTFNRRELLMGRSLPSVLRQTHADIEALVVGDGTDDATVAAMAGVTDPRVRFWNLPHAEYPVEPRAHWWVVGIEALNFGLDQARGEWVAALGDDDELEPDMVEVLLAASDGYDLVYGQSSTCDGSERVFGWLPPGPENFCDGANIRRNQGYRYDRGCIQRHLPEDADLWVRMLAEGRRFNFVERIVHHYYPTGPR